MKATTTRSIAGISAQFVSFKTVESMAKKGTLRCQRDHVERAQRATYLKGELSRDQLVFHAVKLGRNAELADGYTRIERVWLGEVVRPETVLLITHTCKTEDEVIAVYDQLNNPKAAKTGRDRVQEGLRMSGLKGTLTSHLVLSGPLTSAAKLATGVSDPRRATCQAASGIQFVDQLGLAREKVSAGVFGAMLAIALNEPVQEIAREFLTRLQDPSFEADPAQPGDAAIAQIRDDQAARRAQKSITGGSTLVEMRDNALAKYLQYRAAQKRPSKLTLMTMAATVSLGSFIETMKTMK